MSPNLVLASTSPYRKMLLEKLALPFLQIDPNYIEQPVTGETPQQRALRLAQGKAEAALTQVEGDALIIGSDQVAHCGDQVFSKPGTHQRAVEQLQSCSGAWVTYSTAVCLLSTQGGIAAHFVDEYHLLFRTLSNDAIEHYLLLDQPYDCAGSIKAEAHGVMLFEETRGTDINTLYGLPLIRLQTELDKELSKELNR